MLLDSHDLRRMTRADLEELLQRIMLRLRQLDSQAIQREIALKNQQLKPH